MSKEAVICNQQQGAGVFPVVVSLPLRSVMILCEEEAAGEKKGQIKKNGHRKQRQEKINNDEGFLF